MARAIDDGDPTSASCALLEAPTITEPCATNSRVRHQTIASCAGVSPRASASAAYASAARNVAALGRRMTPERNPPTTDQPHARPDPTHPRAQHAPPRPDGERHDDTARPLLVVRAVPGDPEATRHGGAAPERA
jgi:hypothetical protein